MKHLLKQLDAWFVQRPLWLQDAVRRIIRNGAIDANDLAELTVLCKQEAGIADPVSPKAETQSIPKGTLVVYEDSFTLRLEEISNVKGINALSPRQPLKFGEGPLTIIYGTTGSGKSGYVRILKHACGARKAGVLHGNVFDRQDSDQGCTFKVKIGAETKEFHWSPQEGVLNDIRTVEIYDTDCARVYLTEENEMAYEPWVLILFTLLTNACTHIGQILKGEIDHSVPKTSLLPVQFQGTRCASWYASLNHRTTQQDIDKWCQWSQAFENGLTGLNKRLAEPDPAKQAKRRRTTKNNLLTLHDKLKKIRDKLSDEKCSLYLKAKKDAALKRKAADEDAKKVFENAPLEGVGSESWRLLWEQARAYSDSEAYIFLPFPNMSKDARCVLCQQLLDPEARQRFTSFEEFVKGELQKQAGNAEQQARAIKVDIEDILSAENIKLYMNSASVTTDAYRKDILEFHASILERKNTLLKAESLPDITKLPDDSLLKNLKGKCGVMEKWALDFDKDAEGQDRPALQNHIKELETRKWLSEQKNSIEQEVARLNHINKLNKARRLTSTQALSVKKSTLADILISPAFIKRFEDELVFERQCLKH